MPLNELFDNHGIVIRSMNSVRWYFNVCK